MGSRISYRGLNWWRSCVLLRRPRWLSSSSTACWSRAMQRHRWAARAAVMIGRPLCGFSAVNQPLYQGNVTACAPSPSSCSCWSCTPPQVLVRRAPSALRFAMGGMGQAVMTLSMLCHDGLICPNVTSPCLGRYGAGCYNPAYATCYNGLVCTTPLQPCLGPHGVRCYDPGRATCAAGPVRPHPRR